MDVRASFAKLVRAMGPLNTKPGQPLIDCYMVHWPFTMTSAFQVDHSVVISDMWTIMEELVFEGKVRTLGISNFTARQAEQLLEICRIRPAVACFEQHPFCQTPELISFYREQKIAVFASAPHAQAEIHSSAHLKHPRMTPAQACLHWAVEKGISVMPSAKIPAHIVENISVATIEDEPVVVPPGRLLQVACAGKINPGLMPYGICDGTRGGDLGVFDTREGKLFPGTRKGTKAQLEEKRLAAETQPTTGVGHPGQQSVGHPGQDSSEHAILGSINDVLLQITQQDSIHERRLKIDTIINEGGTGQALARMRVVALNDFVACGRIPRRSDASVPTESEHSADRDVSQLTSEDRAVFISQRWLCPGGVNPSPDDELGTKFKQIVAAVTSWAGVSNVSMENVFVWMDFCCVEQVFLIRSIELF